MTVAVTSPPIRALHRLEFPVQRIDASQRRGAPGMTV
jgi:hypothetical protein